MIIINGQIDIGARIKYHRRRKGLSQEKVALRANITTAYLGQIERSKKNPTVGIVCRIADAMQISVVELFQSTSYSELQRDPIVDRILFELDTMSDSERTAALSIIRQVRRLALQLEAESRERQAAESAEGEDSEAEDIEEQDVESVEGSEEPEEE